MYPIVFIVEMIKMSQEISQYPLRILLNCLDFESHCKRSDMLDAGLPTDSQHNVNLIFSHSIGIV